MTRRFEAHPALQTPWAFGIAATLVAMAVLLPGLGAHGIWTGAELPVLQRAQAALGAPVAELTRSPFLPDFVRTGAFNLLQESFGLEAAIRLPHALCAAMLVGLSAGIGRSRGGALIGALAGVLALSFPLLLLSGRTILGNPVGELCLTIAVIAGVSAGSRPRRQSLLLYCVALLSMGGASASLGIALGAALPLAVIAAASHQDRPWPRRVAWAGAAAAAGAAVFLAWNQGDGFIPLLGSAKDLDVLDDPATRRFAEAIEDFGYQLFPWAPLVVLGLAAGRRDSLPSSWLGLALAVSVGWAVVYGSVGLPIVVPAALCAAAGCEVLWRGSPGTRRFGLFALVLAMVALSKDAARTPDEIIAMLVDFPGGRGFPAEALDAAGRLARLGRLAVIALVGSALLYPAAEESALVRKTLGRLPQQWRRILAVVMFVTVPALQAPVWSHGIVDETADRLSPRRVLQLHREAAARGELPAVLGAHRIRDDGLELYGPPSEELLRLDARRELVDQLSGDAPAAALIRKGEIAPLHQSHRQDGWPLYVLDASHADLVLVSNVLPEGMADHNEIPQVLFDAAPQLANETSLQFENYVELVGWEIDEPVLRGSRCTIQLAWRVLRPLPAGTKVFARLQAKKTSRMNTDAEDLTGGVYGANYWRDGDYILHRQTFEVPTLEILSIPHELVIGLRRSEKKNFDISLPEGKKGPHDVVVKDAKRNFARIGYVQVW